MPFKSGIGTYLWVEGGHGPSSFFPEECIIASSRWGGKAFSNETIAVFSSKSASLLAPKRGISKAFRTFNKEKEGSKNLAKGSSCHGHVRGGHGRHLDGGKCIKSCQQCLARGGHLSREEWRLWEEGAVRAFTGK